MKKIKIYLLLISCVIYFQSFCQEQKTYTSKDKKLIYEYYENAELERVYNGKYIEYNQNCIIKGQFSNNVKTGNWYYLNQEGSFKHREYFGNYTNNRKNGVWTYKLDYNEKTKKHNTVFNLKFKNDTIVGKIDFSNFDLTRNQYGGYKGLKFGYKGEMDSIGNYVGIWTKKINTKNEDIIEFYKNFVIKILKRNLETGVIIEKYLPNREKIIKKIDDFYEKRKLSKNEIKFNNKEEGECYVFPTYMSRDLITNFITEIHYQYLTPSIKSINSEKINDKIIFYSEPYFLYDNKTNYRFGVERE